MCKLNSEDEKVGFAGVSCETCFFIKSIKFKVLTIPTIASPGL